jgi:predicted nucleic-acid-binding Zn-ribbon protein
MAQSTCPKCDCHTFEAVQVQPENYLFPLIFIQCKHCGAVVGVFDANASYHAQQNTGILREIATMLKIPRLF